MGRRSRADERKSSDSRGRGVARHRGTVSKGRVSPTSRNRGPASSRSPALRPQTPPEAERRASRSPKLRRQTRADAERGASRLRDCYSPSPARRSRSPGRRGDRRQDPDSPARGRVGDPTPRGLYPDQYPDTARGRTDAYRPTYGSVPPPPPQAPLRPRSPGARGDVARSRAHVARHGGRMRGSESEKNDLTVLRDEVGGEDGPRSKVVAARDKGKTTGRDDTSVIGPVAARNESDEPDGGLRNKLTTTRNEEKTAGRDDTSPDGPAARNERKAKDTLRHGAAAGSSRDRSGTIGRHDFCCPARYAARAGAKAQDGKERLEAAARDARVPWRDGEGAQVRGQGSEGGRSAGIRPAS